MIPPKRIYGLDVLRVIACFLVILLHVTSQGFYPFSNFWETCVLYSSATRMCVPLFFILSGYLLLNGKQSTLLTFYKKRFLRILIPFIITCTIYSMLRDWNLYELLSRVISQKIDFHLWFVYAIIGIYLIIPLFQPLFLTKNGLRLVWMYVFFWFISGVCYPTAQSYFGWSLNPFNAFNFHYFYGFLGYFLVGGLLQNYKFNNHTRLVGILLTIISTGMIFYLTKSYSLQLNHPNELFFNGLSPFVAVQAISFFIAVKDSQLNLKGVNFIAKHSYWIYLIHILVLGKIQVFFQLSINENTAFNILFLSVTTFVCALLISIPLMKIEEKMITCIK